MAVEELVIESDPWLAEQLQRDVYTLRLSREHVQFAHLRKIPVDSGKFNQLRELQSKPVFISSRVSSSDAEHVDHVRFLEEHGFHLIDTSVQFDAFEKQIVFLPEQDGNSFREATPEDRKAVVDIARRSFRFSRFHLDTQIPNELANQIKGAWTENYFNGKRGDRMVVAEREGQIVGFLLTMPQGPVNRSIDLIAVDPKFQGRGVARGMIRTEIETLPLPKYDIDSKDRWHLVGTQLANSASIALYQKLGFILTGSQYVFHFHGPL
ncbi:MAG: N-acetyltransferase family protein [Planctomycetaceae bacterium]